MFNLNQMSGYLTTIIILIIICFMVISITWLLAKTSVKTAQASSINRAYIEELFQEILQDNTDIKTDLADIQEKVASIEKMMKDV